MKLQILALTAAIAVGGALPAAAQPLNERQANQQHRIQQAVHSGALTPHETHQVQVRHQRIATQEHRMRAQQGGRLTTAQRQHLQHAQNVESRQIAHLKHNNRTY
jgi:CRISPR/Cas system-associated endoribonuclease Cas2